MKVYAFGKYILLTWAPPLEENGLITGYELGAVKYQTSQNVPKVPRDTKMKPNDFRALLSDLDFKTKYAVEIVAKTSIGEGPAVKELTSTIERSGTVLHSLVYYIYMRDLAAMLVQLTSPPPKKKKKEKKKERKTNKQTEKR